MKQKPYKFKAPHIPPPVRKSIFAPEDAMNGQTEFKSGEVVASSEPEYPEVIFKEKIETSQELSESIVVKSRNNIKTSNQFKRKEKLADKTVKMDINAILPPVHKNNNNFWTDIILIIGIIVTSLLLTAVIILILKRG